MYSNTYLHSFLRDYVLMCSSNPYFHDTINIGNDCDIEITSSENPFDKENKVHTMRINIRCLLSCYTFDRVDAVVSERLIANFHDYCLRKTAS